METIVLALDFSKVCRICLIEADSMISIYSEFFEHNSNDLMPTISEILMSVSNVHIQDDDMLPNMICAKCIDSAHNAYQFQQQCNKSQLLLQSYVEQIRGLENEENHLWPVEKQINFNQENLVNPYNSDTTDLTTENNVLPEDLEFMHDSYVINEERKHTDETDNYDDFKNCYSVGEDSVDRLIEDNYRVENLEMISPKMNFNQKINTDDEEKITLINGRNSKDFTSMNYYKNKKSNESVIYNCNICYKPFKFINFLKAHLKTHNEEKPYVCTECKKSFKVYGSLMHHIRSHSIEQPFECKECGKKYKQSGTLTAHMRIHTGSKPYLCTICGRGFRQAPDLTYHMRTHTKEKPYMCNVCGKTMSMQCHLVQHMRSHTGEKPFKCLDCEKAFPSSTRLKRHSIVHTTSKPYTCTVCDKTFNRSSSLKVHSKIHSGVKAHCCSVCDKSFLWAHSLRAHLSTHSNTFKETKNQEGLVVTGDSFVKFTTFSVYSDKKAAENESITIFSNEDGESCGNSFQICNMGVGEESSEVETFTLYASEIDQQTSPGYKQLSAAAAALSLS